MRIHVLADHGDIGLLRNVEIQNLIVIHFVDAVTPCNDHIGFMTALQPDQILIHRIRRAPIPPGIVLGDRGSQKEKTSLLTAEVPPFGGIQVLIQRTGIILCQNGDLLR